MTIEELRNQTYEEACHLLNTEHTCAIIRPTSFGKTGILTRFLTEEHYKHVLYLYPGNIIKQAVLNFCDLFQNNGCLNHTILCTYQSIRKLIDTRKDELKNIDLIICDECHKLGAAKTKQNYQKLLKLCPNAHTLGATATPDRMDGFDVIAEFYNNIVVSKYTIHDAHQDDILKKSYYIYCVDGNADANTAKKQAKVEIGKADPEYRKDLLQNLNNTMLQIANIHGMDKTIRTTCDKYAKDTNCMAFITFFSNFKHLHNKQGDVINWFQTAYPDHNIITYIVTSEKKEYRDNIHKIKKLTYVKKTIYLILTCDMLNLGYHTDHITGIVMYRCTNSNTIFTQQYGRTINESYSGIVFDTVDNLHRTPIYKTSDTDKTKTNDETKLWWKQSNQITEQDIKIIDQEADYRELIRKLVAEPISMRCRQTWARWIEKGGDASSMDRNTIKNQKDPQYVPLSPFCHLKQVSIDAVLDEMGL